MLNSGGVGIGAQMCSRGLPLSRDAYFFHVALSARNGMKYPPTTERPVKPTFLASTVSSQSVIGNRCGILLNASSKRDDNRSMSSTRPPRSVAVHKVQSLLVYVLRLSSGRPYVLSDLRYHAISFSATSSGKMFKPRIRSQTRLYFWLHEPAWSKASLYFCPSSAAAIHFLAKSRAMPVYFSAFALSARMAHNFPYAAIA